MRWTDGLLSGRNGRRLRRPRELDVSENVAPRDGARLGRRQRLGATWRLVSCDSGSSRRGTIHSVDWEERGTEHAAEIISWALDGQGTGTDRPSIPMNDPNHLADGVRAAHRPAPSRVTGSGQDVLRERRPMLRMITGVPIGTSRRVSSNPLRTRTHPLLTACPASPGSSVPWIASRGLRPATRSTARSPRRSRTGRGCSCRTGPRACRSRPSPRRSTCPAASGSRSEPTPTERPSPRPSALAGPHEASAPRDRRRRDRWPRRHAHRKPRPTPPARSDRSGRWNAQPEVSFVVPRAADDEEPEAADPTGFVGTHTACRDGRSRGLRAGRADLPRGGVRTCRRARGAWSPRRPRVHGAGTGVRTPRCEDGRARAHRPPRRTAASRSDMKRRWRRGIGVP